MNPPNGALPSDELSGATCVAVAAWHECVSVYTFSRCAEHGSGCQDVTCPIDAPFALFPAAMGSGLRAIGHEHPRQAWSAWSLVPSLNSSSHASARPTRRTRFWIG